MARYTFTVFTPTYDRAATLPRVYDSLRQQTFRDFEWLIVDDGSTDGTDALVAGWCDEATFPIRYVAQQNAGKHVAFNRGVELAEGELFLPLDSDDACVPEALERFAYWWEAIPGAEKDRYSGVTALCRDPSGTLVGTRFPSSPLDASPIDMRFRYKVRGEKWGFHRTDVLEAFPFPEPDGVRFVAESVVWRAIGRTYLTRFVNEELRIYWPADNETAPRLSRLTADVLRGRSMHHAQTLNDLLPWLRYDPLAFVAAAVNLGRYGLQQGDTPTSIVRQVHNPFARVLVAACLPIGAAFAWRDRKRAAP